MGTIPVNMHEAKSRLFELGDLAQQGGTIIIVEAGRPSLDLLPHRGGHAPRKPDRLAGQFKVTSDFNETASDAVAAFEEDA